MKQRWEIVNWQNNKRVELCNSETVAEGLLRAIYPKNHIIREIWITNDGKYFGHMGKEMIKNE